MAPSKFGVLSCVLLIIGSVNLVIVGDATTDATPTPHVDAFGSPSTADSANDSAEYFPRDTDDEIPFDDERKAIIAEHTNTSNPFNAPVGCSMRRFCGDRYDLKQSCNRFVYPVPTSNKKLAELCQDIMDTPLFSGKSGGPTCCDDEQIDNLYNQMSIARDLLIKCPTCYHNFLTFWCSFTCSAHQNKYVRVVESAIDEHSRINAYGVRESYVTKAVAYVDREYATSIYDSCKYVRFAGGFAMDALCGTKLDKCNVDKFFEFMGRADRVHVPFDISFVLTNDDNFLIDGMLFHPLRGKTLGCHEKSPKATTACGCSDCPTVCKADLPYPAIENRVISFKDTVKCERVGAECRIASMECMAALTVISGGILIIVAMCGILLYYCMGRTTDYACTVPATTLSPDQPRQVQMTLTPSDPRRSYRIDERLIQWSQQYGRYAVDHTSKLICGSLVVAIIFSLGLVNIRTTTDPVELWSNKESPLRKEKDFFDQSFGPFFRVEQLIIVPKSDDFIAMPNISRANLYSYFGPVFNRTFLYEAVSLIDTLIKLEATSPSGEKISLSDICYKPMSPDNEKCAVMSPFSYFQNNMDNFNATLSDDFDDYDGHTHLEQCISGPYSTNTLLKLSCLSDFGAPIEPYVVFGDFNNTNDYFTARGIVVTFLLENHIDKELNENASLWEAAFIEKLKNNKNSHFSVSYMTQRSIEDEIERASSSDKVTVIVSYLFMFLYVAFALGQYKVVDNELASLFVHSKVTLGIAGVMVVALSVTSSIGVFAFYGIPATMIILEVQPFLILAVGVDNIFLLVQSYQRHALVDSTSPLKERIAIICGEVIPSMMLTTLSESACFFLGAITDMPAVKTFSMYAGLAILFNFAFQVTCFLALFINDIRRQESGKPEFFCGKVYHEVEPDNEEGYIYRFFTSVYAPALLHGPVRVFVFVAFAGWFLLSCSVMKHIHLGLDEKMAVPKDSYMLPHFHNMEKYMSVGPPVYFVVKGPLDYNNEFINKLISSSVTANQYSLGSQINHAAKYPQNSYIGHPAGNWIDDYTDWLRPGGAPPCCRFYRRNGSFCPATETANACDSCDVVFYKDRPDRTAFLNHLEDFLNDNPSKRCTKSGKAQFGRAVNYIPSKGVVASHFMTYHTPLRTQKDFIRAMNNARFLAKNITCTINANLNMFKKMQASVSQVEVFAYSPYYVFYGQYETIAWAAIVQLLLSLVVIFIVTFFLLGMDPWSAMIIVSTISCILVNLIGLMYWWSIDFNAISVVNLVMSVGISVEFCSHLVRTFALSTKPNNVERTHEALSKIGCSVLSGITFTKFIGVVILAFAHTRIFEVFYFRMFFGIVIIGGLHGLVFLPVFLSLAGPPSKKRRRHHEIEQFESGFFAANTQLHLSSQSPKPAKSRSVSDGIKDGSVLQGLIVDS